MNLDAPTCVTKFFLIKLSRFQIAHLITKAFICLYVLFNLLRFRFKALIKGFRQLFDQF